MAALSRLGLYGGPRPAFGAFIEKSEGTPVVVTTTKGGRTKRKRYFVEVDGKLIPVSNIAEVQSVLSQVRLLAEDSAQQDVKTAITPKPPRVTVRKTLGGPTTSKVIKQEVRRTQTVINRFYKQAAERIARDQEIGRLFHVKLRAEDEEDSILALLF